MTNQAIPYQLPALLYRDLVTAALKEDLGRAGDVTSDSTIPPGVTAKVAMTARDQGVVAGLEIAAEAFRQVSDDLTVTHLKADGDAVSPGDQVLIIEGPARAILTGERVALNFASHLSGIASATGRMVAAVGDHKARICCTRKTTPGLRALEKYAVKAGGGMNHRFGLDDGILIKDNHIAIAGGITAAVNAARQHAGHMMMIEVEVDTLDQLDEALSLNVGAVLLDNMTDDEMTEAVKRCAGKALTEASGRVDETRVAAIAATGVDMISSGALTHSAKILDLGLDHLAG